MLEPVRCPACSTRYGLRPERVRPGIHRARCFQCGSIFSIDTEVRRLLAEALVNAPARETVGVSALDLSSIQQITGLDEPAPLPIQQEDLLEAPSPLEPSIAEPDLVVLPEDLPPSLTLGDLDDDVVDASLDKTLVDASLAPHPESQRSEPLAQAPGPSGDGEAKAPSYASARDAIDKLLAGSEAPAQARPYAPAKNASQMDIEATLAALDSTLSGTHPLAPEPAQPQAPELGSTVHLSQKDILAAMATSAPPRSPATEAEATMRMPLPRMAPVPPTVPAMPRLDFPPPVGNDSNLLKVHLGEEILTNQTVEQVTALIERGRILEHHMVARQFSDHWMEANKVPPLRPAFERLRRNHGTAPDTARPELPPPPPMETVPAKRSLFGGLFNRN